MGAGQSSAKPEKLSLPYVLAVTDAWFEYLGKENDTGRMWRQRRTEPSFMSQGVRSGGILRHHVVNDLLFYHYSVLRHGGRPYVRLLAVLYLQLFSSDPDEAMKAYGVDRGKYTDLVYTVQEEYKDYIQKHGHLPFYEQEILEYRSIPTQEAIANMVRMYNMPIVKEEVKQREVKEQKVYPSVPTYVPSPDAGEVYVGEVTPSAPLLPPPPARPSAPPLPPSAPPAPRAPTALRVPTVVKPSAAPSSQTLQPRTQVDKYGKCAPGYHRHADTCKNARGNTYDKGDALRCKPGYKQQDVYCRAGPAPWRRQGGRYVRLQQDGVTYTAPATRKRKSTTRKRKSTKRKSTTRRKSAKRRTKKSCGKGKYRSRKTGRCRKKKSKSK